MPRYKVMALAVVERIVEADCPHDVDVITARLSIHDFTEVEWIDTSLLVENDSGDFEPVEEFTQADLFELADAIAAGD